MSSPRARGPCADPRPPGPTPGGFARGAAWVALENVSRQVLGLGVFLLLARLLGPASFGLMALATAISSAASLLVELGLGDAIVQRREGELEEAHLDTAFWAGIGAASVLAAALFLGALPLAALAGEPDLGPLLEALAPLPLLTALGTVPQALLVRRLEFRSLSLRTALSLLAGGATGVGMAVAGCGVWSLVGQQLVMSGVAVTVLWRASGWRPRARVSTAHGRELLAFASRVLGVKAIDLVNRKGDDLLIGFVLGPVALGYYALAYQVLLALEQLLSRGFDGLSLSALARRRDDDRGISTLLARITRLAGMAAFPAFLGLAAVAPLAVALAFGEAWMPAVPLIQVLALVGLLAVLFQGNHAVFKAKGRPDLSLKLAGVNVVANLVLLLAVVHWGVLAVAIAYVTRSYLLLPVGLLMLRRLIGLDLLAHLRPLLPIAGAALLMTLSVAGLILWMDRLLPTGILLAAAVAVGAAVYACVLRLLAPGLVHELVAGIAALGWGRMRPAVVSSTRPA